MSKKRLFAHDQVAELRTRFAGLETPPRQLSTREVIMGPMRAEIEKKLRRGWNYDQLAAGLRQVGIDIATNTLRSYVAKARRAAGQTPPSRQKLSSPGDEPLQGATEQQNLSVASVRRRAKSDFAGFDESP